MDNKIITTEMLLADILLRITVLEKMLIDKKVVDKDEYSKELELIAIRTSEAILKDVEKNENIKDFTDSLEQRKSTLESK